MFDTMTVTKAVAGVLGAFLAFLLIGWAGEAIYVGGHGGGHEEQAYVIDTGAEEGGEEAAPEIDVAAILAEGDAAAGEGLFRACQACHKVDGTNGTGPHLDGVVGRQVASVGDFAYSDAMSGHSDETWTPEHIFQFLENPKGLIPGTKMTYAGMRKPEDRANLIAYLSSLGN
jgi:cytochrome c